MTIKTPRSIAVTGVNGFVGKHLVKDLHNRGIGVVGIGRSKLADTTIEGMLQSYHCADLSQEWPPINHVGAIIHLASLAVPSESFSQPQEYISRNSAMVTNMCEYYLTQKKKPRIVIVSSGAIYDPNQPMPLREDSEIGFNSPYAISKVLVENQAEYYRNRGLDCIIARPFNHTGPGQEGDFIVPRLIVGLRDSLSKGSDLMVGNLESRRDYTDVRDVASAYVLLATTEHLSGVLYNVCSGVSTSGEEILSSLMKLLHAEDVKVTVDASKIRPLDSPEIVGDARKLTGDTGWLPKITLEQTLSDIVSS